MYTWPPELSAVVVVALVTSCVKVGKGKVVRVGGGWELSSQVLRSERVVKSRIVALGSVDD